MSTRTLSRSQLLCFLLSPLLFPALVAETCSSDTRCPFSSPALSHSWCESLTRKAPSGGSEGGGPEQASTGWFFPRVINRDPSGILPHPNLFTSGYLLESFPGMRLGTGRSEVLNTERLPPSGLSTAGQPAEVK